MGYTPSYTATPNISVLNVAGNAAYIKDAEARTNLQGLINALGSAAYTDAAGVVLNVQSSLPTASASTMGQIYLIPATNTADKNAKDEFVTINTAGSYSWEQIGSTVVNLSGYVPTSRNIAGLNLAADISAASMKTALGLGALAYKGSASGTLSTTITPNGSISINPLTQTNTAATLTRGDYTPAGTVTVNALTQTNTAATVVGASYTPGGTVSGSAAVSNTTTTVWSITGNGSAASLTKSNKTVPTNAYVASVNTTSETLYLNVASNVSVLGADSTFSGGSVPTRTQVTVVNSVTGGSISATFSGNAATITPTVYYNKATANGATFSGTKATNLNVTAAYYNKATANGGTFTGASTTVSGDVTVS